VTRRFSGQHPQTPLRVAALDSAQGILDGYHFRFDPLPHINLVVEARCAADFEAGLERSPADVALMALSAPVSTTNPSAYPALHTLPRLLERYPQLAILIFSSQADPRQIQAVMEAGARGYIVKDDGQIYPVLAQLLATVHQGGTYYSPTAQTALRQVDARPGVRGLLTQRQLQALSLCAAYPNYSIRDVARVMGVSPSTARNQLSQAYQRLEVATRHEAVLRAEKLGLLPNNRYIE